MAIIKNKSLIIMMCSLSITATASTSSLGLSEKLYKLSEKTYYLEYSLSAEQRQIADELANQIDVVISLPNDTNCGNKTETFQTAYKWAYSPTGLNAPSSEAEKFANLVIAKLCPAKYLDEFKLSYDFAYKSSGMNKPRSEARIFATGLCDYEASKFYAKKSLQCYIDSYNFAYSSSGMNKPRSEAERFANEQCLV